MVRKIFSAVFFIIVIMIGTYAFKKYRDYSVVEPNLLKNQEQTYKLPACDHEKNNFVALDLNLSSEQRYHQDVWFELIYQGTVVALGEKKYKQQKTIDSIIPQWLCKKPIRIVKQPGAQFITESISTVTIKAQKLVKPRIKNIESLTFATLKEKGLIAAYKKDYPMFESYLEIMRLEKKPEGFWGILSDMTQLYGPIGAVYVYEQMRLYPHDLSFINLLNATWNQNKVSQIYHTTTRKREKIYAMAKLGIMGKIWPINNDLKTMAKTSSGIELADVYWAMGKINSPSLHANYYPALLNQINSTTKEVRKQFFHALSNFKQKEVYDFVNQCLGDEACLDNSPPIQDNLYAAVGRLNDSKHQAWLIKALEENNNPYIKAIIANFVGQPLNELSKDYILEKLNDPHYPVHIKYELLKNIADANESYELPENLGKSLLLKHFLLSKYENKGIVLEK